VRATRILAGRGYRVPALQQVAWFGGLALMGVALLSPLDSLGETDLLSAHMAQHLLIADLSAPLLVIGLRSPVYAFLLPRALFAELAKRPDTICPFLGMAGKRTEYQESVSQEHRCYAFGDPAELPVAIERPSGLVVEALLATGHPVVPIHPNAVKASRPRYRAAGGKSDPGDAYLLADLLRTDGHRFRPLASCSDEIKALAGSILHDPVTIEIARHGTAAESVRQLVYPVDRDRKEELLRHLIVNGDWHQVLVFTRTKLAASRLASWLDRRDVAATAIHSDRAQADRTRALGEFKAGNIRVLVATDVAARGLDIKGLSHVFNFDVPMHAEDYVHRIGRTGRAGREGHAFSLAAPIDGEVVLQKAAPSAFWGTPLAGHLTSLRADTIIVAGESTSGCVRATVVDGKSHRLKVIVPEECVFDRDEASHAINLFDMEEKYADVIPLEEALAYLRSVAAEPARATA